MTWTCASWNYCQACWSGGAAQVLPRVQSLREDLVALQEAQTNAALSVWNQFLSGTLTRSEWAKLGQEGPRFLRFYYVDQANRPIWPDLNGSAPPRLLKADSEPSLLWVRSAAGASDRYLARVSRNNKGEWLVVEADLDFIFGAWLAARTQGLSVQVQPAGVDRRTGLSQWRELRFRVKSFLADTSQPLDEFVVTLDRLQLLGRAGLLYGLVLLAGSLCLLGFAAALGLAGRSIRREFELVEANRHFIELVSHELKNPLANIYLHSELLAYNLTQEGVPLTAHYEAIHRETKRMNTVLQHLLDISRGQSGGLTFTAFSENAVELAREAAVRAGLELTNVHVKQDTVDVWCDRAATVQALQNILENARKYGGPVEEIQITLHADGPGVIFSISDRGPGIAVEQRAYIFDFFQRGNTSQNGSGIGLALARLFVEGQRGEVSVHNREEGGTTFRVFLPSCPSKREVS